MNPNDIARAVRDLRYGHLPRRTCTRDAPMPQADKDRYRWSHPDAEVLGPFFNLTRARCPHCGLAFTYIP